jgi:1,4-dihydroxy-2-naphthoate octaprenyltransferase
VRLGLAVQVEKVVGESIAVCVAHFHGEVGQAAMPSRSPSAKPKVPTMLKSNPWQPGLVHTLYTCGHAARPWSFTASYFPMLLTALSLTTVPEIAAVAWEGQELNFLLKFVLVLVGGIGVHAGANLTNTYYDYYKEVDADSSADDRTILDGILAPQTVGLLATCCYAASAAAWAMLVQQLGVLLYVVAGGAFLGWAYTATPFGLKCGPV